MVACVGCKKEAANAARVALWESTKIHQNWPVFHPSTKEATDNPRSHVFAYSSTTTHNSVTMRQHPTRLRLIVQAVFWLSVIHCDAFQYQSLTRHPQSATRTRPSTTSLLNMAPQRPAAPVYLTHERDFSRQLARLESMDSYVLVSTLIASMSFGALLGFQSAVHAQAVIVAKGRVAKFFYQSLCTTIQVVSGLSALFGLYAALVFALTILYGKSALGAERDREYDVFLRKTVRARVNGFRCFSLSLGLFALEAFLVLVERTSFRVCWIPVSVVAAGVFLYLYKDWQLMIRSAGIIYRD